MIWIRFWNDTEQEGPIVGPYVDVALVQNPIEAPAAGILSCLRVDGERVLWPFNGQRQFEVMKVWYANFTISRDLSAFPEGRREL